MMNINDYKNLIKVAQEEKGIMADIAINDILADIMEYRMNPILSKYRTKTTGGNMIDFEDLQQIFLIACSRAISEVDPGIGNPMLFLLQKGKWAVVDALRSTYRQTIKQVCSICQSTTRLHEVGGKPVCPKCRAEGHEHIRREQYINNDDGTVLNQIACTSSTESEIEDRLLIDNFKVHLTGRKLEIFELIIEHGYDRDGCKNYIKEIAEHLGVGQANINLRLRDIKKALREYLDSQIV